MIMRHRPALRAAASAPQSRGDGAISIKLIEQAPPDLRVGHFSPAEQDGQLYLIAMIEELRGLAALGFQIVIVDLRTNPNFLELDDMLILARLTLLAALLIPELAVIHQAANRRHRVRSHFNKIKPALSRHFERITGRNDTDLVSFFVDQPDFANPDSFIDSRLNGSGNGRPPFEPGPTLRITCQNAAPTRPPRMQR